MPSAFRVISRFLPLLLIPAIIFISGCAGLSVNSIDGMYADSNATYFTDLENGSILYMEPTVPGYHQLYQGHYTVNGSCINITLTHFLSPDNIFQTMNETKRILTKVDNFHLLTPDGTLLTRLRRVSINKSLQNH